MRPGEIIEQVLGDPHLAARQMLIDIATSERPVKVPGNPIKLSALRRCRQVAAGAG